MGSDVTSGVVRYRPAGSEVSIPWVRVGPSAFLAGLDAGDKLPGDGGVGMYAAREFRNNHAIMTCEGKPMGKKGTPECENEVGKLNDRGGGQHLLNVNGNVIDADGYLAGCANMKLTPQGNNAYVDKDGGAHGEGDY